MKRSLFLLAIAVLLVVAPLLFIHHSDFGGTDGQAEKMIQKLAPHYQPWMETIFGNARRRGGNVAVFCAGGNRCRNYWLYYRRL